ncbi:MAG: hypothetical protein ACLQIB_30655 [Isosphaeraceae bacterium]
MTIRENRLAAARASLIVLASGLAAWGCTSGAPHAESSRTEARVTGRVTAGGKPIAGGRVIFDPANVNRRLEPARTAEIRKDGTFEVTTLIGANRVTVAIPARASKKGAPYVQKVCEVQAGDNTFDIAIP